MHSANIITVAVSSDELLVATGSTDRTIGIFSLESVAANDALQPLAVLKVADAVCLDISWGRWRVCMIVRPRPLQNDRCSCRAPGTQHLFFASFMSGALPVAAVLCNSPSRLQGPPAYELALASEPLPVSRSSGEVAIVDARSGVTLGKLKQVRSSASVFAAMCALACTVIF